MTAAWAVSLSILAFASLATLIYWSAVGYHVIRTQRRIPTARAGLELSDADRSVCVIVPAHNEESCIAEVARTLVAQDHPALTCVFVLDRCTDQTRTVLEQTWRDAPLDPRRANRPRLEVLEISACPQGWSGKSHALWHAVQTSQGAASAELLLFIDADTSLHPGLIRAAVALMTSRGDRMLSLLSSLTHDRWFEKLVQPATTLELLRQYPIVRANARPPDRRRAFANGQFILIEKNGYLQIGGHEAIRDEVLEDVLLARRCEAAGLPTGLYLADALLGCRMYDSFDAFSRGWRRIYIESANRKPARLRKQARRLRLLGTILPVLSVSAAALGIGLRHQVDPGLVNVAVVLGVLAVCVYIGVLVLIYRGGRSPLWTVPGFPIGCWIAGGILRAGAADLDAGRPIIWAGREYVRQKR